MEQSSDSNVLFTCKVCGQTKVRNVLKSYDTVKQDKAYVDENGKRWNGKVCPSCHKLNVRTHKRNKKVETPQVS